MSGRILICGTQVPFSHGGAELLVDSLAAELSRRGHRVEVVRVPFAWSDRLTILKSALAWRLLDLTSAAGEPIDLVIPTRFPSYLVRHPRKVVWLVHQFRQVYELKGTRYSDFTDSSEDRRVETMIRAMDRRTLGEARRVFTISGNTAERLDRFLGVHGEPLYPPPALVEVLSPGEPGDYVFTVGRLDAMKRFDLLLRAMAEADGAVRCKIAGSGPEEETLRALAVKLGVADRVELLGRVDDADLPALYAGALAVFYAPYDEDYGYVTVEAFKSGKPVLTTDDSGGVLEFVEDGVNGFVRPSGAPSALGETISRLHADRALAQRLGEAGRRKVEAITWDRVVERLTATL